MIAIDTNILVYAHRRDSAWHSIAAKRVAWLAEAGQRWGLPWPCVHEFVGVVTHPKVYSPASTLIEALAQIDAWRASPGLELLGEGSNYWETLRSLAIAGRVVGPRVHDAHVAALCRERGVAELWSSDRDFSRFPGLKVVNPLH